jgi:hypothetical protein
MKLNQIILITALFSSPAFAHESHTPAAAHAMTDAQAIEHNMKKLFDKPDAPLAVAPVTIEGDYAMAGWLDSIWQRRPCFAEKRKRAMVYPSVRWRWFEKGFGLVANGHAQRHS